VQVSQQQAPEYPLVLWPQEKPPMLQQPHQPV
jgi:hypothetical protein